VKTRFLHCVLDTEARVLMCDDVEVHLTPKAFEVLVLLVSERPRAIAKSELLETVWPGTFVTDASLARTIHELRVAIGDANTGTVIRTVHRHGYAFVSQAHDEESAEPGAAMRRSVMAWLVTGCRAVPLVEGVHVAGRDPTNSIHLDSAQVSWHHARLTVTSSAVTIEDLQSKNGTIVRGEALSSVERLHDGDEIVIGGQQFTYKTGDKPTGTETSD
jgi:DNA-binding winged helix-turn-helix (wHTH) protein